MAEISAALVKELRDRTGAGMMDCKRALQETNGDIDAAVTLLRERGMAQAAKRAGRETTEGKVGYRLADDGSKGTMVAVGCETEPVSNNDEFLAYAKKVLELVERSGVGAESELEEERVALVRKARREHRRRRRRALRGGRRRAGRRVRASACEQARRRCCSCAAATPTSAARSRCTSPRRIRSGSAARTCPRRRVASEREIYANSDEVQSKPEQAREKIVEGMLNKRFFGANVLADQEWIHDSSKSVGQALKEAGAEVLEFERFALSG